MKMKFRTWHALTLVWIGLVAFLVYRDVQKRSAPQNPVIETAVQTPASIPRPQPTDFTPAVRPFPFREEAPPKTIPSRRTADEDASLLVDNELIGEPLGETTFSENVEGGEETDEALARLYEALHENPDDMDAKYKIAEMLTHEKWDADPSQKAEAEKFYTELLELNPNNPYLKNGLATLYEQTGRVEEAVKLLSSPETP